LNRQKFLSLLFDPGQLTCYASTPYDTALDFEPAHDSVFFSINALKDSRRDDNVVCYRNFLIELDNVPLGQQMDLVMKKLPVSAITFSGNKSYHFIISLKDPVQTSAQYAAVWRGLHDAVPQADKTTKNPSRLSRLPEAFRPDTRTNQSLVYVGSRISLTDLPKPIERKVERESTEAQVSLYANLKISEALENPNSYMAGRFSGRNQFFYWLGKRCSEAGLSRDQKQLLVRKAYEKLQDKKNFSIAEAYSAARVRF
jgi:hypothetical protein